MKNFDQALSQVSLNLRCFQTDNGRFSNYPLDYCFFGVPSSELYGRAPLERMPIAPTGVSFLGVPEQAALINAFMHSSYTSTIRILKIGSSSYAQSVRLDYSDSVASLKGANCPHLKTLHLGIWELFSNSHCAYGRLGDVTEPFNSLSSVEELGLWGHFELSRPLTFNYLKVLSIESNDPVTGINGGPIANLTLNNLLSSQMPKLESVFIDLFCHDGQPSYTLPDCFLFGSNVPCLNDLEMDGRLLTPGERERLLTSPLGRRQGIILRLDDF